MAKEAVTAETGVAKAGGALAEHVTRYHKHVVLANQTAGLVVKRIKAPLELVWSIVRKFDEPQRYKRFVTSCNVHGDGSVRDVFIVSGLPATRSTEKLEILDDERHIVGYRILDGDHRLKNYKAVVSLLPDQETDATTMVESYVVDVPEGNTEEDTRSFVETLIKCNHKSLAGVLEH